MWTCAGMLSLQDGQHEFLMLSLHTAPSLLSQCRIGPVEGHADICEAWDWGCLTHLPPPVNPSAPSECSAPTVPFITHLTDVCLGLIYG